MVGRFLLGECAMVIRICEDGERLRQAIQSKQLEKAIGAYAVGVRTTDVMNLLAECHVWAANLGQKIPCPTSWDRTTWTDSLNILVAERLGDRRCLDCGKFFLSVNRSECHIGLGRIQVYPCSHCGGTTTEPIQCVEEVV